MGMPSTVVVSTLWRPAMRTTFVLQFSSVVQLYCKCNLYLYCVLSALLHCAAKSKSHVMSSNFTQVHLVLNIKPSTCGVSKRTCLECIGLTLTPFSPVPTVPQAEGTIHVEVKGEKELHALKASLIAKTERASDVGKETPSADSSPSSQHRKHPKTKKMLH